MAYLFETEEHAAIRATVRRFAQTHIAPHGADWEESEEFPVELYKTAAAAGIQGIGYPEAMGGQGGDLGHVLAAQDELILPAARWAPRSAWARTASRCRRSSGLARPSNSNVS